jgi:hypothetical protein
MNANLVSGALILVGLFVLIVALIFAWRGHLVGKDIIDLHTAEKLGGLTLKTNAFGLIFLAGCALVASGVFLYSKNYDDRLTKLVSENDGLNSAIDRLRAIDQNLNLIFPADNPPNPHSLQCSGFVFKKNENQERRDQTAKFIPGPGGIQATFRELKDGDFVRVEAVEVNGMHRKWTSNSSPFGTGELNMGLSQ